MTDSLDVLGPLAFFFTRWDLTLPLLCAHLLADFTLQTDRWVEAKTKGLRAPLLWAHAGVAALLSYLFLAKWEAWWLLPALLGGHGLIDGIKARFGEGLRPFLVDQLAHLLLIGLFVWFLHPRTLAHGSWLPGPAWLLIIALQLVWDFQGILVGKATARWRDQLEGRGEGELEAAGMWIGRLERVLILVFVLVGHFEAVGFLVTAKSIFRFERGGPGARKESEYFLVGTLGSFSLAILTGLAVSFLLARA